jgi:alpha-tubulin suppressor-like RCC1 family protein
VTVAGNMSVATGKTIVNNSSDTGVNRGIRFWSGASNDWAMYMSQSGTGKAANGGTAPAGYGFNSHAIRVLTNDGSLNGFIVENRTGSNNFSVRGSDGLGYLRGGLVTDSNVTLRSADESTTVGIFLGTPNSTNSPNKAGIFAFAKTSWSRSDLHFCLDNTNNNDASYSAEPNVNTRMVIQSDGNVGIGTTAPTEKLEVSGNLKVSNNLKVYGSNNIFNVGRGDVYIENNALDNEDGAGITLRALANPTNGSMFAVRSSGNAARLWVGQNVTSVGMNKFCAGFTGASGEEGDNSKYNFKIAENGDLTTSGTINGVTAAQLGYLSGITSDIQSQLNVVNTAVSNSGSEIIVSDNKLNSTEEETFLKTLYTNLVTRTDYLNVFKKDVLLSKYGVFGKKKIVKAFSYAYRFLCILNTGEAYFRITNSGYGDKILNNELPFTNIIDITIGGVSRDDYYALLGNGTVMELSGPTLLDQNTVFTNVIQISSSYYAHTLFLLNDGTVKAHGYQQLNQLGNGVTADTYTTYPVDVLSAENVKLSNIIYVCAGYNNSLFITSSNTAMGVGNPIGLGPLNWGPTYVTTIPGISNVIKIAAGAYFTMFLLKDGTVFSTGEDYYGQLGDGSRTGYNQATISQVKFTTSYNSVWEPYNTYLTDVIDISCGTYHTLFLLKNGTVCSCGRNNNNELGTAVFQTYSGAGGYSSFARNIVFTNDPQNIVCIGISTGDSQSYLFTNSGNMISYGDNYQGVLTLFDDLQNSLSSDDDYFITARHDLMFYKSIFYDFASSSVDCIDLSEPSFDQYKATINSATNKIMKQGYAHGIILADGVVYSFGNNEYGERADTTIIDNITEVYFNRSLKLYKVRNSGNTGNLSGVIDIACGNYHSVFLLSNNTVFSCGLNNSGQLGINNTTNRTFPTRVKRLGSTNMTNVTKVFAGGNSSFFVRSSTAEICATGENTYGQLGINTTTNATSGTPVKGVGNVGLLTNSIKDIRVGFEHVVFLAENGVAYASGNNNYFGLGVASTITSTTTPVIIQRVTEEGLSSKAFTSEIKSIYTDPSMQKTLIIT